MTRFLWGRESQGGQAILLVAVTMMGMLMMVGLAIDAGQLYAARRTMQEAADAGAYAGAVVLYQGGTQAEALAAAASDVTRNGYTHDQNGYTVIVREPSTGPFVNNPLYVEVIVEGHVQTALVPAQSVLNFIRVRGVAGSEPLNNEYAIMALNRGPTACAFSTAGSANIHLDGGGILVNSSSSTAACNLQQSVTAFTIDPNPPHGVDINGGSASAWPVGMDVDTGQPQQADPFAGFPRPSTTCTPDVTPCTPMVVHNAIPPTKILDPGVWNVTLVGSGNDTLILRPGIYVLKGGTNGAGNSDLISVDLASVPPCFSGCGVFLFNTHTNYPGAFRAGIDSCGALNLTGNGSSRLAPMTTGTYKGFLIYQDPACTNGMTISGNGSFQGSGTIYLPSATFTLDGNNATLSGSQLIANRVVVGTGNLSINFTAGNTAQPILPRLAE